MPTIKEIAAAINATLEKDERIGGYSDRSAFGVLDDFMQNLIVAAALDPDEQALLHRLVES